MARNTAVKCDGCEQDMIEGEKDVIEILQGTLEMDGTDALVQPDKTIWQGHKKCCDTRTPLDGIFMTTVKNFGWLLYTIGAITGATVGFCLGVWL